MMRLNKCYGMLEKILNRTENPSTANQNGLPDSKVDEYIDKIISMGIIQLIYKNCSK